VDLSLRPAHYLRPPKERRKSPHPKIHELSAVSVPRASAPSAPDYASVFRVCDARCIKRVRDTRDAHLRTRRTKMRSLQLQPRYKSLLLPRFLFLSPLSRIHLLGRSTIDEPISDRQSHRSSANFCSKDFWFRRIPKPMTGTRFWELLLSKDPKVKIEGFVNCEQARAINATMDFDADKNFLFITSNLCKPRIEISVYLTRISVS